MLCREAAGGVLCREAGRGDGERRRFAADVGAIAPMVVTEALTGVGKITLVGMDIIPLRPAAPGVERVEPTQPRLNSCWCCWRNNEGLGNDERCGEMATGVVVSFGAELVLDLLVLLLGGVVARGGTRGGATAGLIATGSFFR